MIIFVEKLFYIIGVFMNREIVLETNRINFTNVSYDLMDEYLKLFNNPNVKKYIPLILIHILMKIDFCV